jgi:integrase
LASNDSASWKSNQLKALRKYIRDFLKLGNWINDFDFSKTKAKVKNIPSDQEISRFIQFLDAPFNLIFLILHNSGLRIGEIMSVKVSDIDFDTNMINVSNVHEGDTKSSWISFFTKQTASYLKQYIQYNSMNSDSRLFAISERSVQNAFKEASDILELR